MALIALTSAKGSPGATTTALAMTLVWPHPVLLVEADLAGPSILPGYFRGQVPHNRGLGHLAIAHSHGELGEQFWEQTMPVVAGDSSKKFLPGIAGPHAAPAVFNLWPDLTTHLVTLERGGMDVIVDLGRIGVNREDREILLRLADQVVVVTRSRLSDIAVTRELARAYLGSSGVDARDLTNLSVLTIGPGRPYDTREIAKSVGLADIGSIAWDPAGAAVLSDGAKPARKHDTGPLMRSVRPAVDAAIDRVARRRERFSAGERS